MSKVADHYDRTYSRFSSDLNVEMRREVYGEDIGQHSWVTSEEQIGFARKAGLGPNSNLLDVGCGSGGPAIFLARTLELAVTGVDINEAGIAAANAAASAAGLEQRAKFVCLDGGGTFPFADQSFDTIQSIDAVNHIPDRRALLMELYRLLRPGGSLLYTDPVVVTGPVSSEEIATRSSIGFFVFMPPGENERVLQACGFDLVEKEDVTANIALISARWLAAREKRRDAVIEAEGAEAYERQVEFSRVTSALSSSRRLSRVVFLARRS